MAALDCAREAENQDFQKRVKYFMQKAAIAVMAEDTETPNHADRVIYAGKVLDGTASIFEYAMAVVTNSTISASVPNATDNDLEFTVNSMFDAFSG